MSSVACPEDSGRQVGKSGEGGERERREGRREGGDREGRGGSFDT